MGIFRSALQSLRRAYGQRQRLVIRPHPETKQCTLDVLRWGLIPYWAKDPKIAYKRIETVDTAPAREPESP
jgi:putative SOS response-associated peptidase YedK